MRVELLYFREQALRKLIGRRVLAGDFIAKPPNHERGMVAVSRDHLAHLLEAVFENIGVRFGGHALESFPAPGGDFTLHKNAVAVAVIEHAVVLGPMVAREHAIQVFQVVVIVQNPALRLGHAEFGIAASHALDTHQTHTLAVQMKGAIFDFESANAKGDGKRVTFPVVPDHKLKTIEMRMVEMP